MENNQIDKIKNNISEIELNIKKLRKIIQEIKVFTESPMDALTIINKDIDELNNIFFKVYRLLNGILTYSAYDNPHQIVESKNVKFKQSDGKLYIKFDELPPKRSYNKNAGYHRDLILGMYQNAFKEYFNSEKDIRFLNERVLIKITFCFTETSKLTDLDNFDIKALLDLITGYCLVDDSPQYYTLILNHKITKEEKTIIMIKGLHKNIETV